ncbi:MAG TPA: hydrogen gas-evolving membrane-bound hydrogenase subunit E [Acidimicrobiales bacterium]|nr:hydrogen gas-evolving membrane-bound hydrogenase subunit E [Acidimicrobiales bacterium]
MIAILAVHALVALLAPAVFARFGRRVFVWCAVAPASASVWLAIKAGAVIDGQPVTERVSWVPQLGLQLSFRLDALSVLMVALVSGIGVLVFLYAVVYFAGHENAKLGVFAAELTVFAGSMFGLVVADNIFLLFVFWELTAVTSYLLIGYNDDTDAARSAARQAILMTSAGGLALLAGLVLLAQAAGTTSLHQLVSNPPSGGTVTTALVLVVLGAATKSAQAPFHSWLPAAMAAPTPVSAYLHSATMVKAGVYLIARLAPPFSAEAVWRPLVITIGLVTMFVGGYRALRQHDLKLLLAYGTVSQLGLLFVLFGSGSPTSIKAGTVVLLAHGIFKAALFLTVGVIDHTMHTRDLRQLDGLGARFPLLYVPAVMAAASMAGIPPLLGFIGKELVYEHQLHGDGWGGPVVLALLVVGSSLTVAYSARFVWGAFGHKRIMHAHLGEGRSTSQEQVSPWFIAPVLVLGALSLVFGLVPALASPLVMGAARALDEAAGTSDLVLWHGFTAALALSMVTIALGVLMVVSRDRVERMQARVPSLVDSDDVYHASVNGMNRISERVTGIVQNGSLPMYLAVISLALLALPGVALVRAATWPDDVVVAESPVQIIVVALLVAAAVSAALVRRRFVAALLVGAVGYAVAALFVIQGGPDLALTQLLVETLTVVVFVLVLRHLPERFPSPGWRGAHIGRGVVALGVGGFVTLFTIVASGARQQRSVADDLVAEAVPRGGGRNVVNVILTDFRALDTLGEISVITVAALGITSLVLARRSDSPDEGGRES